MDCNGIRYVGGLSMYVLLTILHCMIQHVRQVRQMMVRSIAWYSWSILIHPDPISKIFKDSPSIQNEQALLDEHFWTSNSVSGSGICENRGFDLKRDAHWAWQHDMEWQNYAKLKFWTTQISYNLIQSHCWYLLIIIFSLIFHPPETMPRPGQRIPPQGLQVSQDHQRPDWHLPFWFSDGVVCFGLWSTVCPGPRGEPAAGPR